jgi:hypothetical protein
MKIQYGTDEKFRRYINGGISQMKRQFRGSIKIFHNHTLAGRKNILRGYIPLAWPIFSFSHSSKEMFFSAI